MGKNFSKNTINTKTLFEVKLAPSVAPLANFIGKLGVVIVAPNFSFSHSADIPNLPDNLTAQ